MRSFGTASLRPATRRLLATALLVLVSGALIYLPHRPSGSAYLLPATWGLRGDRPAAGVLGGSWPTFAHAFAFSVMTCLLLPRQRVAILGACVAREQHRSETTPLIAQHPR